MASVRAGTFEEAGTTSSVVITKPTGTAEGDLLIAAISTEDHTTVTCSSRPSGWTRLDGSDNGNPEVIDTTGGDMRLLVFKKTAGASEGTSYTFGLSASVYTSEAMVAIQSPGSVAEILPLSESLAPGTARVDNVTIGTDEVAVSFFVGYTSGSVESLNNWSNVTGATRFVKSTATTRAAEETGTGTGGGAMDNDRWTSVVIRIAAASGNATVTPAVVTATVSVPAPTVATGSTVTPAVVTAAASVPAPTVATGSTVTAPVVTAATSVPAPTVATGATVTPAVVTAAASVPAPTVATGVTVTASVVTATVDVPAPTVTTGGNAEATPAVVTATVSVPAPSISTGVTVTATAVTATVSVPAPTISTGATASPTVVTATVSVPAPTVSTGATVTATVVTATVSAPAPTVATGSTATPAVVTATVVVLAPTVTTGVVATDRFIAPTYRERRYAPTFYDARTGTRPIWLDPDVGTATTPDPGTLPNEFVFVAQVRGPNGDGTVNQCIVTQYEAEGQRSWFLRRNETNGSLNWGVTPTGNAAQAGQLTVAAQAITGAVEFLALAVTLDNGSSQRVVTSWRSLDNGVTWTSIATATGSVITPWDSTGVVRVGAFGAAGDRWDDRIYSVELRTGLDPAAGTVLWRFDATNYDGDGTAWTDPRGRTWTATSASALIYGAAPRHQAPTYRERRYVPAYRGEP